MKKFLLSLLLSALFAVPAFSNPHLLQRQSLHAVASGTPTGVPLSCSNGLVWTAVIADGFTGTVKFQVLMVDGSTWQNYNSTGQVLTGTGGVFTFAGAFQAIRALITTFTSGTCSVDLFVLAQ